MYEIFLKIDSNSDLSKSFYEGSCRRKLVQLAMLVIEKNIPRPREIGVSVWFQDGKFLKKYILLSLIVYYQRKLKTIMPWLLVGIILSCRNTVTNFLYFIRCCAYKSVPQIVWIPTHLLSSDKDFRTYLSSTFIINELYFHLFSSRHLCYLQCNIDLVMSTGHPKSLLNRCHY